MFKELYDSTLRVAGQTAENKYRLVGSYKSQPELRYHSMPLTSHADRLLYCRGLKLTENIDYSVDYTAGHILQYSIVVLESGTLFRFQQENQSLFNLQTKTLLGTHLDYRFSEDFNIGATVVAP